MEGLANKILQLIEAVEKSLPGHVKAIIGLDGEEVRMCVEVIIRAPFGRKVNHYSFDIVIDNDMSISSLLSQVQDKFERAGGGK